MSGERLRSLQGRLGPALQEWLSMPIAIANRYARALADVVSQKGDYRQVRQELENYAAVYGESAELREVFDPPAVPLTENLQLPTAITVQMGTTSTNNHVL